jgi:hypothetical protein
MNPLSLFIFALAWTVTVYVLNSIIAGQLKRIEWKEALLYVSTVAMIGLFGEIFLDTVYRAVVGHPLWIYNILPIHNAYTSSFAIATWGIYGLHLYLLHGSLSTKWSISRTRHLSLIFCLEALLLEALLTISAKLFLGTYMYYYLPGDLWHVSSFQNIPFYFLCGVIVLKSLKRFRSDPLYFSGMAIFLTGVIAFAS